MGSRASLTARRAAEARRYRLLRVELTELRDELLARDARPAGRLLSPGPLAERIQRMLDRGSAPEMDEP